MKSIIRLIIIKPEVYIGMKISIMLLFSVVFAGLLIGCSYAQTNEEKNNDDVEIFMQIVLRNSDGILVGYIEGTPQIFHIDQIIDWVEPKANKSTIIKDGKKFEMLQFGNKFSWSETPTMGAYFLKIPINGKTVNGMYFHFDSFHISSDDTVQVFWTVFRPAD